jgi:CheY-like chemotaxis protein
MDVQMPVMDGYEATKAIASAFGPGPVRCTPDYRVKGHQRAPAWSLRPRAEMTLRIVSKSGLRSPERAL